MIPLCSDILRKDFRSGGVMANAKQQVESLLHKLPENCSLEDIQYHLYVLDKVRQGLRMRVSKAP